MTSRRRFLPLAASAALAAPFVLRPHSTRAAETVLRLHHFLPPVSNAHQNFLQPWARKVEAASNRTLRVRIFPSMQLGGTPPQLFDQARDGVVDIVWTLPGYTPGRFTRLEALELPFIATRSGVANSKVAQALAAERTGDELKDIRLICAWANDHGVIHCTKPIHRMEDLQGTKLRFPTRLSGEALKALGAGAVGMPVPQVPELLAQRVIDGAVVPWEVVPALKLQELVTHHTEFPGAPTFYTSMHFLVMNKARYEGLAEEARAALDAHSGEATAAVAGGTWDTAGLAATELARKRGNELFVLPADEVVRWQAATQPVVEAWVKAAPEGGALLERTRALVAQHAPA